MQADWRGDIVNKRGVGRVAREGGGGCVTACYKSRRGNSTAVCVEMRSTLYDIWVTESGANKGTLLSLLIFRGAGGGRDGGWVHVQ